MIDSASACSAAFAAAITVPPASGTAVEVGHRAARFSMIGTSGRMS